MADAQGVQRLAQLIQDLGYRAKLTEDERVIKSSTGGLTVSIFYYPSSGGIQFHCGFRATGEDQFWMEQCNTFNREYRFAKAYAVEGRGLSLELDYLFDVERDEITGLENAFGIWESSVALMKETLAKAQEALEPQDDPDDGSTK